MLQWCSLSLGTQNTSITGLKGNIDPAIQILNELDLPCYWVDSVSW